MFRPRNFKLLLLFLLFILPQGRWQTALAQGQGLSPAAAGAPLALLAIRYENVEKAGGNRLHIIADFNHKPDYSLMVLDNPPRFIVNLPATQFSFAAEPGDSAALLRDFRFGASGPESARLVFGLRGPFRLQISQSAAYKAAAGEEAWRIIWEIAPTSRENFRQYLGLQQAGFAAALAVHNSAGPAGAEKSPPAAPAAAKDGSAGNLSPFIIVLDPGHGAFDNGATGINNTREKQVTLAFAQALYRLLQAKAGIKPYLTRDTDSFLRLGARVEKARRLAADLFISIHADHIAMTSLHGATLYTLSDKASDDMAKLLAEHENKADLLDGLPGDEPPAVADILLDMTRRETRLFSEDFARMTVAALQNGQIALIKNPHRFAGFQVLKAADIPSVLIELGYLSNSEDEKSIADPLWQDKIAHILADTIADYAWKRGKIRVKP